MRLVQATPGLWPFLVCRFELVELHTKPKLMSVYVTHEDALYIGPKSVAEDCTHHASCMLRDMG